METKKSFIQTVVFITGIIIIATILLAASYYFFQTFLTVVNPALFIIIIIVDVLLAVIFAYLLIKISTKLVRSILQFSNNRSILELVIGGIGAIIALVIAFLLGLSIGNLPLIGIYLNVFISLVFAYLGWNMAIKRKDEILGYFGKKKKEDKKIKKIVDTSVLIDGRIVDIVKTGFIEGSLIVPDFVLDELQRIADSEDDLKRNRGRRGLDVIKKIQNEKALPIVIEKTLGGELDSIIEVDSKLVQMAKLENALLLTNDFNLNKVAIVQGVKVLNINELANAVKSILLTGEEFTLEIRKKGKEDKQGIGYLEDGTMIIIEDGEELLGQTVDLVVTSIMQTSAGRLIFAKKKGL